MLPVAWHPDIDVSPPLRNCFVLFYYDAFLPFFHIMSELTELVTL